MRRFEVVIDAFRKHPDKDIILPKRATDRSAGYDICTPVKIVLNPGEQVLVWTDIKAMMTYNNVLEIVPRSSMSIKKDIILKNIIGIIDADYYNNKDNDGNIGVCLKNIGNNVQEIEEGTKICQGIFKEYLIVWNEDGVEQDRHGGFGSTGV